MKPTRMQFLKLVCLAGLTWVSPGCHIEVVGVDGWDDSDRVEVTGVTSRTLGVQGQTALRIEGLNGTIEILGAAGAEEVSVYAVKRVRSHSRADAQEHLGLLQVSVGANPGEFVVRTIQPDHSNGRDYQVDYQITVPREFEVNADNANGSVQVEYIRADVRVQNLNGNVILRDQHGSSWVTVANGQIDAQVRLPDGGELDHSVGNGWLKLTVQPQVSAGFVARVGNGTITMSGLELTNAVSGLRVLRGVLGSGAGSIDLSVGNGWVRVEGG